MFVVVSIGTEVEDRAASALAGHPAVERIGLIGRRPSRIWAERMESLEDATGFGVVIGASGLVPARAAGSVLVTAGTAPDDGPSLIHASPLGLAKALAALHGGGIPAMTVEGEPAREGPRVVFPAPLGVARSTGEERGVRIVPVPGDLAGISVSDDSSHRGLIDDRRFLAAVTLAAGAFLAHRVDGGPVAAWEVADDYVAACEGLGLVSALSEP